MPSERLYGFLELRKNGWDVDICDSRFTGISGRLLRLIKPYGFNLVDFKTINSFRTSDIIIIKDDFSLMATLAAKIMRKKIIYFDAMFDLPERFWRRWLTWLNIRLADAVIAYSSSQIELWSNFFKVPISHFKLMHYTIDLDFYQPCRTDKPEKPFVLAVGRDMGRDFNTLAESLEGSGIELKLVTLPYLVKGISQKLPWVEIYERLSYVDLFELYDQAMMVVVPLKSNLTYPSGIRGVLESMALGKATICTRTPVLDELFTDGNELLFVNAGDKDQLREKIIMLRDNKSQREAIQKNAQQAVRAKYGMKQFVEEFEKELFLLK